MRETSLLFRGARTLALLMLSMLLLSFAVFSVSRLAPGDPLQAYYGERAERLTPEQREAAMERLGLNEPLLQQYGCWLGDALRGDWGASYQYQQPVWQVIRSRAGNTVLLGGLGFLLTAGLALVLGLLCAWREDGWTDRILTRLGTLVSCIPEFWVALVLILLFSVTLGWLPSSGAYSAAGGGFADRLRHLVLPLTVVVTGHLWQDACLVRNLLLEEVRAEYVLLARSKGLSREKTLLLHCLRNILPAWLGLLSASVPHILGGTYLVETVFSYPGLGRLCYESARYRDYPLLMALTLLTGVLVLTAGFLARMLSERLDPRLKQEREVRA